MALNNRGQVVGLADTSGGSGRAFIWDKSNGMQELSAPAGLEGMATALNDVGQIIGHLVTDTTHHRAEPCFWHSTDVHATRSMPLLPPDDYPGGHDINNKGCVLGVAYHWDKDGNWTFLWRHGVEVQWLFPLEDAKGKLILNDANQVLYSQEHHSWLEWLSKKHFPPYVKHYLWDPKRGRIDLDDQVPQEMGNLLMMQGLNNKGCIVGLLRSKDLTRQQGVLLEPVPEQWDE